MSRRQLLDLGLARWDIRAEIAAGRWRRWGRQTLRVDEVDPVAGVLWRALFEVGPSAVLDGASALVAAGLRGVDSAMVHVAVPKSANPRRCTGVVVHETRRYEACCVVRTDVPRMRPATAAVHAALWARTDREAALMVIASAQQGLFSADDLGEEVVKIKRDRRRALLRSLHGDVISGIESMGERDFARLCRARGFPEPTRQAWHVTADGERRYDTIWERYSVSVEIDGSHHSDPRQAMQDALKQNHMSLQAHTVLRIPNLALRIGPDPFMDQVEAALRAGGWTGPAALRPKKRSL